MGKIAVYKYKRTVIPVDQATIGTGYHSKWSHRVYLTKQAYLEHLKEQRQIIAKKRIAKQAQAKINELYDMESFDEIIDHIENNCEYIGSLIGPNATFNGNFDLTDFKIIVRKLDLVYDDAVSNSHACPKNGVTNFSGTPDLPRGYPGFKGSIEVDVYSKHDCFINSMLTNLLIHTGTGGVGYSKMKNVRHAQYDVKLFLDEWPGLKKVVEQHRIKHTLNIISEKETKVFSYKYTNRNQE